MKKLKITLIGVILMFSTLLVKAQTEGTLDFMVTTVENDGNFSPRHVLAIWIETASGDFVKTLKINANNRIQYLYTWNTVSEGNVVDATTGGTLTSHVTHTVSWDGTNTSDALVNDGEYVLNIEYTSAHEQGPLASFSFNKGSEDISLTPADETYFHNISLTFTPVGTTSVFEKSIASTLKVYPNPFSESLSIEFHSNSEKKIEISIYNLKMQKVVDVYSGNTTVGMNKVLWNSSSTELQPGNYYLLVKDNNSVHIKSIITLE